MLLGAILLLEFLHVLRILCSDVGSQAVNYKPAKLKV